MVSILRLTLAVSSLCAFSNGKRPALPTKCDEEHKRIVLIKTHKTGSSTLANIVYRFGESRGLRFMLPADDLRLGWPEDFPGKYVSPSSSPGLVLERPGDHKEDEFDVVAHHAVLNHAVMLSYVPKAKFITILRDPVSQFTSAWYFFPIPDLTKRKNENAQRLLASSSSSGSAALGTTADVESDAAAPHAVSPPAAPPPPPPPAPLGVSREQQQQRWLALTTMSAKEPLTMENLNLLFPPPGNNGDDGDGDGGDGDVTNATTAPRSSFVIDPAVLQAINAKVRSRLLNSQAFTLGWANFRTAMLLKEQEEQEEEKEEEKAERGVRSQLERELLADADKSLVSTFLAYLDTVMDVVLVVERLDESLVIMARAMCWGSSSSSSSSRSSSSSSSRGSTTTTTTTTTTLSGSGSMSRSRRSSSSSDGSGSRRRVLRLVEEGKEGGEPQQQQRRSSLVEDRRDRNIMRSKHNQQSALVEAVAYLPVNVARKPYAPPTDPMRVRLKQLLTVDTQLYAWANKRLSKQLQELSNIDENEDDDDEDDDEEANISNKNQASSAASTSAKTKGEERLKVDGDEAMGAVGKGGYEQQQQQQQQGQQRRRQGQQPSWMMSFGLAAHLEALRNATAALGKECSDDYDTGAPPPTTKTTNRSSSSASSEEIQQKRRKLRGEEEEEEGRRLAFFPSSAAAPRNLRHPLHETSNARDETAVVAAAAAVAPRSLPSPPPPPPSPPPLSPPSKVGVKKGASSARCWRHSAEQRSWAQHLKSLAGLPCMRSKYGDPARFDDLPFEIKQVAEMCSDRGGGGGGRGDGGRGKRRGGGGGRGMGRPPTGGGGNGNLNGPR